MKENHYIDELVSQLKKINPYLIILFGSYAYGTPDEDSDIDILLEQMMILCLKLMKNA